MNILLNIPDEVVGKYQEQAKVEKRSRKNMMEKVLIEFFEKPKRTVAEVAPNGYQKQEKPPPPPRISVEHWIASKREIPDAEAFEVWFKALQADPYLSDKQKSIIKSA